MADMKLLCVDFDGVVHSYKSGWKGPGEIPDLPVPSAFDWLAKAVKQFDVCIYSSRSCYPSGISAMRSWFQRYGLAPDVLARLSFPTEKPAAFMTVDDRAFCFEGDFPDLELLEHFVPWNKREFVDGKLDKTDQGELAMKFSRNGNIVRVDFNKPVAWIGLPPEEARQMAQLLLKYATATRKPKGEGTP